MKHDSDRKHVLQIVAFTLTISAALVVLLVPGYMEMRLTNDGPEQVKALTLLEAVGPSIFVPLLIPVALTGLPLLLTGRARNGASIATTVALAIFTVVGSASIGWFYLPATIAAFIALFSSSRKRETLRAHPTSSHGPSRWPDQLASSAVSHR